MVNHIENKNYKLNICDWLNLNWKLNSFLMLKLKNGKIITDEDIDRFGCSSDSSMVRPSLEPMD